MPRYKVWNPDVEAEEDALIILETSPELAAENYVAQFMDNTNDSYDLEVADEDDVHYDVNVEVDYTPHFISWARKLK